MASLKKIAGATFYKEEKKLPNFSIYPYYKLHLFDPDQPIYYDIGPRARINYNPLPGIFSILWC